MSQESNTPQPNKRGNKQNKQFYVIAIITSILLVLGTI